MNNVLENNSKVIENNTPVESLFKEQRKPRLHCLLDIIKNKFIKPSQPVIKDNTFIVWEPCSKSHSEVVPGYVKYLIDLGYDVSVCVNPDRYKEGLFSRFQDEKINLNYISRKQVIRYLKNSDLSEVKGVLVTTAAKLCDEIDFDQCYKYFNKNADRKKIFFVAHEAKPAVDAGTWKDNLITLRKLNYKNANSVVVNPHYFGDVRITDKNDEITNFITIGALRAKRKNSNMIIDAVSKLHNEGVRNFKITVVGKGELRHLPKELRQYFDIKGRLGFEDMYKEIEKSDFILTAYDDKNIAHQRYNTTGTSGNFQLVYGFLKPCIINEGFSETNGFNSGNAILYKNTEDYTNALKQGISMTKDEYKKIQENLKHSVNDVYQMSKENLKGLIDEQ